MFRKIARVAAITLATFPILFFIYINVTPGHFQPSCNCCGKYKIAYATGQFLCKPCIIECKKPAPTYFQKLLLQSSALDLYK